MIAIEHYEGREQAYVKHVILRTYLQKLVYIICSWQPTICYVDAFAGPWKSATQSLEDTSPHIAIREIRAASDGVQKAFGRRPDARCVFIEKGKAPFRLLQTSLNGIDDVATLALNSSFGEAIPNILEFCGTSFTFFFVDPTGWKDISLDTITPILKHQPGEVLITFMTEDVLRFIDDPASSARETLVALFGDLSCSEQWTGLDGQEKEDAVLAAYADRIKTTGGFSHVLWTPISHRTLARTRYHLVYGTRHIEGLRVFRDTEQHTFPVRSEARSTASERERLARTRQLNLIVSEESSDDPYLAGLRQRSLIQARQKVIDVLRKQRGAPFDLLEVTALSLPFVWLSDLKSWCDELRSAGQIRIDGLKPRAHTPQRGQNHHIVWIGD